MKNLWPLLEVIEANIFGSATDSLAFPDEQDQESDVSIQEMPEFLRDQIHRRVESRKAKFNPAPQKGQVWRFDCTPKDCAPLCVLIVTSEERNLWHGYLVAPETDYASDKDVLLEPQDEPFDPLAGMVQTWNPVYVDIRQGYRVIAQLDQSRIAAIEEIAANSFDSVSQACPGFIAPLSTHSGAIVLAGTRIGLTGDQRIRYQQLYRKAASQLIAERNEKSIQDSNIIPMPKRQHVWRNIGWSLAASIILAQSVLIANQIRDQSSRVFDAQSNPATQYRAVPLPPFSYTYLDVYFKPNVKQIEFGKLLRKLNATIVDGPGEFGQYRLKVQAQVADATEMALEDSGMVDSVKKIITD